MAVWYKIHLTHLKSVMISRKKKQLCSLHISIVEDSGPLTLDFSPLLNKDITHWNKADTYETSTWYVLCIIVGVFMY